MHPSAGEDTHELYLMCDDLDATIAELRARGVSLASDITEQSWGRVTSIRIANGSTLGLYQPKHPLAIRRSIA
jgi:hypothetical protein